MAHAERAPLLGARVSSDSGREDDLDDVFLRRRRRRARAAAGSADAVSSSSPGPLAERARWSKSSIRRPWFARARCRREVNCVAAGDAVSNAMVLQLAIAYPMQWCCMFRLTMQSIGLDLSYSVFTGNK